MEAIQVFEFEGSPVTFMPGKNNTMVNATEMAKPFGKNPWKWLELPTTKEYIKALSEYRSLAINQLVTSVKGGNSPEKRGNWFHEDLALEFARWLNPRFAIWCNDRILELLKHGITGMDSVLESILKDPIEAAKLLVGTTQAIIDERKKNQELNNKIAVILDETEREAEKRMAVINKQMEQLGLQAPKVEYHDKVLDSKSLIRSTIIAKELGMSATTMLKKLRDLAVIWKVGGVWVPTSRYQGSNIAGTTTFIYQDSTGVEKTSINIAWTEAGRKLIHELLDPKLKKQA